jgi:hypothetical protein
VDIVINQAGIFVYELVPSAFVPFDAPVDKLQVIHSGVIIPLTLVIINKKQGQF